MKRSTIEFNLQFRKPINAAPTGCRGAVNSSPELVALTLRPKSLRPDAANNPPTLFVLTPSLGV